MVYAGAGGNTAREIRQAFRFPDNADQLSATLNTRNLSLVETTEKSKQRLALANALCLTGGRINPAYIDLIHQGYKGEIFPGSLDQINSWVSQKTEGRIPWILKRLDPNSACVLLNAIYFKGSWENAFDQRNTGNGLFRMSGVAAKSVAFMDQTSFFRSIDRGDFKAISLPYKGGSLAMSILLPSEVGGLMNMVHGLTSRALEQCLEELESTEPQKVHVCLPRFKLESGYDLIPPLQELGINDLFDAHADLQGMEFLATLRTLYVTQVVHKAYIDVNEAGTEAAAATAVEVARKAVPHIIEFKADHPFLFIIRDQKTRTILFIGSLVAPG